jgi:hypothetical protein
VKYAPSLVGVGQLSGSSGSTTASHNRFGSYLRNRVIPVNPNSTSQQAVRALFGGYSQAWRGLSDAQREGWNAMALNIPRVDPLGSQYFQTGAQLFVGTNINRDAVGDATTDDAPALDAAPVLTSVTLVATIAVGGTLTVAYTGTGGSATNNMIVRASAPRSAGRQYVGRGELKQILAVAGNVATPIDIQAAYEAVFGANWLLLTGMEIVVELVPVSENGYAGVGVKDQEVIS